MFFKENRFVYREGVAPNVDKDLGDVDLDLKGDAGRRKVEIRSLRSVDDAGSYLGRQETAALDRIDSLSRAAEGRVLKFVPGMSGRALKQAVHEVHEKAALAKIRKEAGLSTDRITRVRQGWVSRWGAAEVALATGKVHELGKTRTMLETAINDNKARAEQYTKMLEEWRASGRIKRKAHRSLLKRETGRVAEIEKVVAAVSDVETSAAANLAEYDALAEQRYARYLVDEREFRTHVFSFPSLAADDELRTHFDDCLAADQRDETGPYKGMFLRKIDVSPLSDAEKSLLQELYRKFMLTRKDRKMREMIDARNIREKVPELTLEQMKKLPVGQDLTIEYPKLTKIDEQSGKLTASGKVKQNVYILKNDGDKVVFRVMRSDVAREGTLTRTGKGEKPAEAQYARLERSITVNYGDKTITHELLTTNKRGIPVEITDSGSFSANDRGAPSGFTLSGEVATKFLA